MISEEWLAWYQPRYNLATMQENFLKQNADLAAAEARAEAAEKELRAARELYASEIGAAEKRQAALVEALRAVEWSAFWIDDTDTIDRRWQVCPVCDWKKQDGHEKDCKLGAALSSVKETT